MPVGLYHGLSAMQCRYSVRPEVTWRHGKNELENYVVSISCNFSETFIEKRGKSNYKNGYYGDCIETA